MVVLCVVAAFTVAGGCCNVLYADVVSNGNDAVVGYWANPISHPDAKMYGMTIYGHDQALSLKDNSTIWYSCEWNENTFDARTIGTCKKIDDTHYEVTAKYGAQFDDWRRLSNPHPITYELVKRNNSSYLYNAGQAALDDNGTQPTHYAYKWMGYTQYL